MGQKLRWEIQDVVYFARITGGWILDLLSGGIVADNGGELPRI